MQVVEERFLTNEPRPCLRPGVGWFGLSSKCPHPRVAICHLGRITTGSIGTDNKPNQPVTRGTVSHTGDLLVVHVQRNCVPLCYHPNGVGLSQSLMNSQAKNRLYQGPGVGGTLSNIEFPLSILTDREYVRCVERILSAEGDPPGVAFENRHLHLEGEVAEVWGGITPMATA